MHLFEYDNELEISRNWLWIGNETEKGETGQVRYFGGANVTIAISCVIWVIYCIVPQETGGCLYKLHVHM